MLMSSLVHNICEKEEGPEGKVGGVLLLDRWVSSKDLRYFTIKFRHRTLNCEPKCHETILIIPGNTPDI